MKVARQSGNATLFGNFSFFHREAEVGARGVHCVVGSSDAGNEHGSIGSIKDFTFAFGHGGALEGGGLEAGGEE